MLIMCQDFDMPNCIRLWDTLFSDPKRYDFLNYVMVAIVLQVRDEILEGDFAACMEALQQEAKQVIDVHELLDFACEIRERYLEESEELKRKQEQL